MLFVIANCKPSNYEQQPDKMSALSNLLQSHGKRNNIVLAPKGTLEDILDSPLYSYNDKRYANDILSIRREYAVLKEKLDYFGIVEFENSSEKVVNNNGTYEVTVSYQHFTDPLNAGPTPLVTENSEDHKLYTSIGEFHSKFIARLSLNINLRHILGAGSHSKCQFDSCSTVHPFLLCLVDNDKAHPNKGEGSTSSQFSVHDRSYNNGRVAKVINVREIESLIPNLVISELFNIAASDVIDNVNEFMSLAILDDRFRTFFDHKDGLNLKQAIELDNKHGEFWLPLLGNIKRFRDKECFAVKNCDGCLSCPKIEGLGKSLLSNANLNIANNNKHRFKSSLETNLKGIWEELGSLIMTWGCIPNSKVTRS